MGILMRSTAPLRDIVKVDRPTLAALTDNVPSPFQVAFLYSGRPKSAAHPAFEQYRKELLRERVPSFLFESTAQLACEIRAHSTWVAAFDADDMNQEELIRLLEVQSQARAQGASLGIIAWCSHGTSPAKLWRLFHAGASLCERNVAPEVLLRSCRLAAGGGRAPLLRFTERAGLSSAERRAFFAECAGLSKCEAADELGCSQRTLETYWSRIFAKLRIRSTDGVVAAALRFAMLDPGTAAA
jgi:DNA-binding CsgD family transcriptional regulator